MSKITITFSLPKDSEEYSAVYNARKVPQAIEAINRILREVDDLQEIKDEINKILDKLIQ